MGLFDFIKGEFIEVIEYDKNDKNILVYKYPISSKQQIKNEAQLIVGPSQIAIFVYEGQIADMYTSGKYTLNTDTMPILTSFKNFKYAFNSPFKTDVYFINTSQYLNQKWGTSKPITMRDQDFGIVRLRSFGNYSFKINEFKNFLQSVIGAGSSSTLDTLSDYLKSIIISTLSDVLSSSQIPAIDIPIKFEELNAMLKEQLNVKFKELSLTLTNFTIESVSLPEEVEKAIDKRASIGAIGNLDTFAKYNMADSIKDAAKNEGGMAGMGASMTIGAQMGNMMANTFNNQSNNNSSNTAQQNKTTCANCNAIISADAKFCSSCGNKTSNCCIVCNEDIPNDAKFCPHCGSSQSSTKKCECGNEIDANAKFCNNCGKAQ